MEALRQNFEKQEGRMSLVFSVRGPIPIQLGEFLFETPCFEMLQNVKKTIYSIGPIRGHSNNTQGGRKGVTKMSQRFFVGLKAKK